MSDRLFFAFLLACDLLISEGRLDELSVSLLPELWNLHSTGAEAGAEAVEANDDSYRRLAPPTEIPWLRREAWNFFAKTEKECHQLKGKTQSNVLRELRRNELNLTCDSLYL
jgi:hypothetical protein